MRWGQKRLTYGNPKWHLFDGGKSVCKGWEVGEGRWVPSEDAFKWLPADRRPAMARNNVCAHCKKAYIASRPDLRAAFDLLNNTRDV